jgi:hypothetical protein
MQILDQNLEDEPVDVDLNVRVLSAHGLDDSDQELEVILNETDMRETDMRNGADTPQMISTRVQSQLAYQDPQSIQKVLNPSVQKDTYLNDVSMVTTQSEIERYELIGRNITSDEMIQSTIYHIRKCGKNLYDPQEREKYYNDDFLTNGRHVNERVEEELQEFKMEIEQKVQESTCKFFQFPRPHGNHISMNTSQNRIVVPKTKRRPYK